MIKCENFKYINDINSEHENPAILILSHFTSPFCSRLYSFIVNDFRFTLQFLILNASLNGWYCSSIFLHKTLDKNVNKE